MILTQKKINKCKGADQLKVKGGENANCAQRKLPELHHHILLGQSDSLLMRWPESKDPFQEDALRAFQKAPATVCLS